MTDAEFRAASKQRIMQLLKQWQYIEYWLKRAENLGEGVIIASVNELRYAGRMLFGSVALLLGKNKFDQETRKKIQDKITVAEQYMVNAQHDIVDAVVLISSEQLNQVLSRFRRSDIERCFQDFTAHERRIEDLQNRIQRVRLSPDEEISVVLGIDLYKTSYDSETASVTEVPHQYKTNGLERMTVYQQIRDNELEPLIKEFAALRSSRNSLL